MSVGVRGDCHSVSHSAAASRLVPPPSLLTLNDSGYALTYVNGPPPGAEITVTIGGATCMTSD